MAIPLVIWAAFAASAFAQTAAFFKPPPPPVLIAPIAPVAVGPPAKAWPFDSFGPPGRIASRRLVADLGVTQVRFANGVRLNLKQTSFAAGQILVSVRIGDGLLGAPAGKPVASWLANLVVFGGAGDLTYPELQRSLGGALAAERFSVGDDAFTLNAVTRTTDLARALQLMTATISRPAFRAEGMAPLRDAASAAIARSNATPQAVLDRDLPELLHNGDARWRSLPSALEIVNARPSDAQTLVAEALKSGAVEVTIVGDFQTENAVALAAATLGTLSARPAPTPPDANIKSIRPPAGGGKTITLMHTGQADRAIGLTFWPARDFYANPRESRALLVTAAILRERVKDRLNARGLGTYTPGGGASLSYGVTGFGFVEIGVELPPWQLEDYRRIVTDATRDLARSGPTQEELRDAMSVMTSTETKARTTNAYWLALLAASQADPRALARARSDAVEKPDVTSAEVSAISRTYLIPARATSLEVRTADAPTPATAPRVSPETLRHPGEWAQSYSDLTADPQARFGVLPNGMRYVLKRNVNPAGETAIRLRIGAGSIEERDDQRGLAHVLEHMAFKGSTHVAQGEMVNRLERLGVSFGPDVNAFTQKSQTFYKLDLPRSDDDHLNAGLTLMREIADQLLIAPSALNAERGVVLSEERLDESPGLEAGKTAMSYFLEDQLAARRDPMGSPDVIKHASAAQVRSYYNAWYRPDNATLIMVGDFDVAAMQNRIFARFGDWRPTGAAVPRPDLGVPKPRGESARIIAREGLVLALTIAWIQPFDDHADTFARQRADLVRQLGLDILNKRLSRMALATAAPFVQAGASRIPLDGSASVTQLNAAPNPGGLDAALRALVQEQRRIVEFGASREEFQEAMKTRRDNMGAPVPGSATKPSAAVADQFLGAVNDDRVIMSAVGAFAQFDAEARSVTLEEVNAGLKTTFAGAGPLILLDTPAPVPGGEIALRALYDQMIARPLTERAAETTKPWPYADFGPPGKLVSRTLVGDLGVTQARFANGVRLNVRPTSFAKNQIVVTVRIGDGLLGLPPNSSGRAWLLGALTSGGTKELSFDEIERTLKGLGLSANFAFADDALVATGTTGPRDFPRQMELLTALISRPGYRPEGLEHARNLLTQALPTMDFTPGGVLNRNLQPLLHGDQRWQGLPTSEALAAAKPSDLVALVDGPLKSGAMEVTVVGDITPERAIFEVARTLGTLATRAEPKPVPASSPTLRPPTGGGDPLVLYHKGRADQAIAFVEWPTQDFYADTHEAHVLWLAADILQNRLIDRVRIRESASYAPSADSISTSEEIGYGFVYAQAEIPPARIDGFYKDIEDIVADLGRAPPSADELLRARAPLIADEEKARQTLEFWTAFINHSQSDPRELASIRRKIPDFQSITADEISAACRKWLTPATAWKLVVRAQAPAKP